VAGGIHGRNRLGGNSLLDCVVFGRVAGGAVAASLLRGMLSRAPASSGSLAISAEQVGGHSKEGDCWVILNGKVYDVTAFLPDHPGGKKAILAYAGKDASEEFNALHNPNVLVKYLPKEACLGVVADSSKL